MSWSLMLQVLRSPWFRQQALRCGRRAAHRTYNGRPQTCTWTPIASGSNTAFMAIYGYQLILIWLIQVFIPGTFLQCLQILVWSAYVLLTLRAMQPGIPAIPFSLSKISLRISRFLPTATRFPATVRFCLPQQGSMQTVFRYPALPLPGQLKALLAPLTHPAFLLQQRKEQAGQLLHAGA